VTRSDSYRQGSCVFLLVLLASFLCSCQEAPQSEDIHQAARDGDVDAVRQMLAANPELVQSVDEEQRTPLYLAAGTDSAELVEVLMAADADVNAQTRGGDTPLHLAVLRGSPEVVEAILQEDPDLNVQNSYGRTPLLYVARETGDAETATRLLDAGAEINVLDRFGASPLELAAWRGFEPLVDLLLERGAELPAAGEGLNDVTVFSAQHGLARLFALAVENGTDLDMANDGGGTLLHSAAEGGSADVVGILLEEGKQIDARDRYGWTPLHYATREGHEDVVSLLLSRGASAGARTLFGDSPYNLAAATDRESMLQLLENEGVSTDPPTPPLLTGPYFGQSSPGRTATIFAPDIVSSNRFEHGSVTFAPDGMEAFWSSSFIVDDSGYSRGRIMTSKQAGEAWAAPDFASFSTDYVGDDVPHFLPDGSRLFFLSSRPGEPGGESPGEQIWYVDRTEQGWSDPILIGGGPNELSKHWQFSVAANGNIYFNSGDPGGVGRGDIYVSRYVDGNWEPAENLGPTVNTEHDEASPFIAPDESYLIVTGMDHPDNVGTVDLYISFKGENGEWTPLTNMGEAVNTSSHELCPFVTTDGRYLFFNSHRGGQADIFWIEAEVIEQFRPGGGG
jgi:ankyrin repeat protein